MPDNCVMEMEWCERRKKYRATIADLDGDPIYLGPWRVRSGNAKRAARRQLLDMFQTILRAG